jgi:hypothetical protein
MASAAGNGRPRRQASRLPASSPSRHEAAKQIHGLPAPIRIRWYRTRALAQEGRGPRPSCWTDVVALAKPDCGWRQTVGNSRPDPELALKSVEAAARQALAGLDGPWSARIAPLEAFCVEIASPDGFLWLAFIPDPRRQGTRAVARRLRDACRHRPSSSRLTRWKKAWIIVTEGLS